MKGIFLYSSNVTISVFISNFLAKLTSFVIAAFSCGVLTTSKAIAVHTLSPHLQ